MPGGAEETPASAGISLPSEAEVDELFARLQQELAGAGAGAGTPARVLWRGQAERAWSVSAERPLVRRPGPRGLAAYAVKRALRPFLRWYVEPLAAEQRVFNDALLKLVDDLFEAADRSASRGEAAARALAELEERLARLERRRAETGTSARLLPQTVAAQPAAAAFPDYFAFESRMRGSTASIRERQRVYVDDLREAAPVLDLGCGRGELLLLLREAGVEARGVDADRDMVAYARGEGLDVEQADAIAHLESLADASLGGVFAGQLVEHLPPPALLRLLQLAAVKLRPGGLLVAETINPLSPLALRSYYADLTHAQPLVPETLELLARQAGFRTVETRFLNEPEKLTVPDDPVVAANVRRLNELLFAPLDYAILART
ncbi:MAG TPA: methyltransferase domain-containing protein [Gaiellaceae bacterium]|nr:methyltransferase domain-containing protein [Gaiellaceae bacterium]